MIGSLGENWLGLFGQKLQADQRPIMRITFHSKGWGLRRGPLVKLRPPGARHDLACRTLQLTINQESTLSCCSSPPESFQCHNKQSQHMYIAEAMSPWTQWDWLKGCWDGHLSLRMRPNHLVISPIRFTAYSRGGVKQKCMRLTSLHSINCSLCLFTPQISHPSNIFPIFSAWLALS